MPKRSKSSSRWLAEHANDEFVKRAQKEGWRSRAVFKLAQIQEAEHLLRPGMRMVDLGAAPGGWSQYAARIVGGKSRIVATDILPMDAISGVEFVQGDFRDEAVLAQVLERVGTRQNRPCFVGYGPQHGRNRCRGPASLDVSRRTRHGVRGSCFDARRRLAGEIISRRRLRTDHSGCPRALWSRGHEKAEGVTNSQS